MINLISKYNVAAPRYTSYPTVPYWDPVSPSTEDWLKTVRHSFEKSNSKDGISLYIHLPFCESLCTYCACNTRITVNHSVELPYIDAVLKEWKMYLNEFNEKPVIREIHLGGGTPTFFSPENLNRLIKGILKDAVASPDSEFSFEAHPGNTTKAHLQALYDLGFRRVSFGIQDFDPVVQDVINRIQTFSQVEEIVAQARHIGYASINFDLIYGLPMQTRKSVIDTIEKVKLLMPERIAFYSYAHVPWIKPGQRKFTEADLPIDIEKRALYELGRDLFSSAGYFEIGMDHFALATDSLYKASENKLLHRNFMGYTHNYTRLMIGLGVSSISDSWNAYMQNVKKVEEYLSLVNRNILPVFKGHLLNSEDLVIRKHILNIMCRLETNWEDANNQNPELNASLSRLVEMESDLLLEKDAFHLKVTQKGKAFLRNICMAFDARLWRNLPQSRIFSSAT
jgi:oxygen-independent coproporphyrinogen-3 oxidase